MSDPNETSMEQMVPLAIGRPPQEQDRVPQIPRFRERQGTEQFTRLEAEVGYNFQRRELLVEALTHRSAVDAAQWNERLEFLGDSVLGLAISTELFRAGQQLVEGELSKLRAAIVNEKCLAAKARSIRLGEFLILGRGEEIAGGRYKDSILADAVEALLGAVYLDGGFPAVQSLVVRLFRCELDGSSDLICTRDFKTELQEHVQGLSKDLPVYEVVGETGPAHQRTFEVTVKIDGALVGRGTGCSKKRASIVAAREALTAIEKTANRARKGAAYRSER